MQPEVNQPTEISIAPAIESLGTLTRKIELSLPYADLSQEKITRLKKLSKTVRIDGFRKGKVPLSILEKQYGDRIEYEVRLDKATHIFFEIARAQNLQVAGIPKVEFDQTQISNSLGFTVFFEIYPKIILGNFTEFSFTKMKTDIDEAQVDKIIDILNAQHTENPQANNKTLTAILGEKTNIEELRLDIRKHLEREVKRRIQHKLKKQVFDSLIESIDVDLPKSLVEEEKNRLINLAHNQHQNQNQRNLNQNIATNNNIPLSSLKIFTQQAERRVKLGLIFSEIVKVAKLNVDSLEIAKKINASVEDLAEDYETPAEIKRWYYADNTRLANVESLVIENSVLEFVLSQAKIKEEIVSFEKLTLNNPALL